VTVILLGLAIIVGGAFYAHQRQAAAAHLTAASAIYFSLLTLAAWMGLKKRPAQTPYEHARQLEQAVPETRAEVQLITQEFVRQVYSQNHSASSRVRLQLSNAWNTLRPRLYRAIVKRRNPFKK
jgi:hypothetical protein